MNGPSDGAGTVAACLAKFFPRPAYVAAAPIGDYVLFPEEKALVAGAVSRRRLEFSTGRALARDGLRYLGFPDAPLLIGKLNGPLWPTGARGAISHDGQICAVCVMRESDGAPRFGFDIVALAEREGRMTKLAPIFVATPEELAAMFVFELATEPALLLFSLKESLVKALSADVGAFIDLRDMQIHLTASNAGVVMASVHLWGRDWCAALCAQTAGQYLVTSATLAA